MASVFIRVWAGGILCSVAFMGFDVGVCFAASRDADEGVRSMGDLLLIEAVVLNGVPESFLRYLVDRLLNFGGIVGEAYLGAESERSEQKS